MSLGLGTEVQITLIVAANKFSIFGERHITLLDTGAHAGAGLVTLFGVLGELERAASAVADGEIGLVEEWVVLALLKFSLEPTVAHFFNQVERARPKLHVPVLSVIAVPLGV